MRQEKLRLFRERLREKAEEKKSANENLRNLNFARSQEIRSFQELNAS
jgi:hypothetical protein